MGAIFLSLVPLGIGLWNLYKQGEENRSMIEDQDEQISAMIEDRDEYISTVIKDNVDDLSQRMDRIDDRNEFVRDTVMKAESLVGATAVLKEQVKNVLQDVQEAKGANKIVVLELLRLSERVDGIYDLPGMATPDQLRALSHRVRGLERLHGIANAGGLVGSYDPASRETPASGQVQGPR